MEGNNTNQDMQWHDYTPGDGHSYTTLPSDESGHQSWQYTINTPTAPPISEDGRTSFRTGMRRTSRQLLYALLVSVSILAILACGLGYFPLKNVSDHTTGSALHAVSCPFTLGSGMIAEQNVQCRTLSVPQVHDQPTGRTITLMIAIFTAPNTAQDNEPVIYLTGGPGGSALNDLGPYITAQNLNRVTLGHKLILLDQRGTGNSRPALNCHEIDDLFQASTANPDMDVGREQFKQAARSCKQRLTAAGVDLNAYNTLENAKDVHDLIQALGSTHVNLYGVSYGTRLALTVMRLFPNDLRSVILDSTVPTQLNIFSSEPAITQHAFDTLLQGCMAVIRCDMAYPDLSETFYRLVDTLNARPITFTAQRTRTSNATTVTMSGDDLVDWIYQALYVTRFIPILPALITQISQGDYTLISRYYNYLAQNGRISYGMYYAVECSEDLAFTTQEQLDQALSTLHSELRPLITDDLHTSLAICKGLHVQAVPASQKQAVHSTIPTLLLAGEYDPITPPDNGQEAEKTLGKSFFFEFPGTGHGVFLTNSCPDSIMNAFLLQPTIKPDGQCIDSMQEPRFQ